MTTPTDISPPKPDRCGLDDHNGPPVVGVTALVKLAGTVFLRLNLRFCAMCWFGSCSDDPMRRSGGLNGLGPIFAFRGVVPQSR